MQDAETIATIRDKYTELLDDLDERGRRRWAAVEERALRWGGIAAVAPVTGLSDQTTRIGLAELDDPHLLPKHRQRKSVGGRKPQAVASHLAVTIPAPLGNTVTDIYAARFASVSRSLVSSRSVNTRTLGSPNGFLSGLAGR
jgi:hypothetical protein